MSLRSIAALPALSILSALVVLPAPALHAQVAGPADSVHFTHADSLRGAIDSPGRAWWDATTRSPIRWPR